MTTYHHISLLKPGEGGGGVERFAAYLGRVIPDIQYISMGDFPERAALRAANLPEYDWAINLNTWLLNEGALGKDSVVIVDGYWGLGLQGKVKRLISVCHGAYWGRFVQSQVSGWGEVVGRDHVDKQSELWESPGVDIVAVSEESRREVLYSCNSNYDPHVINNGVDTDLLCPISDIEPKTWMHAATSYRKGMGEIASLSADHNIRIELMGPCKTLEDKARRLNEATVFVQPTHHEGNAYVLLEAMACGVPVLTYLTGAAHQFDERCGIVTDDLAPHNLARKLRGFQRELYHPREWVLENASLNKFCQQWKEFLGV